MMQAAASSLVVQRCSLCSRSGRVRCSVCKAWYCTALCQADHWPVHRRVCVPVPGLEWPDGSKYEGDLEDGVRTGQLEIEHISDEESMSMKEVFVGRARIENIEVDPSRSSQRQVSDEQSMPSAGKEEVAAVDGKKDEKISLSKSVSPPPDKLIRSSSNNANPKQPAVDIRSKTTPGSSKAVTSPAEPQPVHVPVKPVTAVVKQVPTPTKLSSNVVESVPTPRKLTQTLAAKPFTPPKTAVAAPKPVVAPTKAAPVHPKPVSTPVVAPTKPTVTLPTAVTISTPVSGPAYLAAYQSITLPPQVPPPPGKLSQIVLPVEDLVSPANFSVRLTSDDALLMKLLEGMNENPPPAVQGWTVGRRETVAAYFEDIWYRGLAVKKTEGMFSIYLLDFGGALVNVAPDQLRPLAASLRSTPAVMYQVCIAGLGPTEGEVWGDEVGQLMGEIVNSDLQYKLGVEFLGQVDGGRWVVKLSGIEDEEDIGNMMVDGGLAIVREDGMIETNSVTAKEEKKVVASASKSSITAISTGSTTAIVKPVVKTESKVEPMFEPAKAKPASETTKAKVVPAGPKIPRGVLPVNNTTVVGVCFLDTPDKFYVCPSTCIEQFMAILSSAQSAPPGLVSPVVGSCCLAMDEDCWYRAEMVKLSADKTKATLFLLDYGKTVQAPLSTLRPLPGDLTTTPGLVCLVSLRGVKSGASKWSPEEIAGALLVLDVGGETQFKVKNVELDKEFKTFISMEDLEENDVADLMIETGIAEKDEEMVGDLKLIPGTLAPGQQQLLVLSAASPMEINLCSQAQFLHFSDTIVPMVEEAASKADKVLSLAEGDIVLACEDQVWYRATIVKLLPEDAVKVKLVDLAIMAIVSKDKLRVAKAALMKEPVVAVSCCLDTWVKEDRKMALENWGDKMEGLLEQYSEVDVEVVDMLDNQANVRIPTLDQKLGKKELSRAEMLKMKLKQKK